MPAKGSYTVVKPSAAELSAVKPYLIDKIVRWAQDEGHCETVEDALNTVFGARPANDWRDSDGFDCYGFDVNGYNAAGLDENGYDKDGFDSGGFGKDGYNKEGYNYQGFNAQGWDKEGYNNRGYNAEGVNRKGEQDGRFETYVNGLSRAERSELIRVLRNSNNDNGRFW